MMEKPDEKKAVPNSRISSSMAFKRIGEISSSSEDEDTPGSQYYSRAKLSKNTGATNQSKQILQAQRIKQAQNGVLGDFDVHAKNHRLHRPMMEAFDREETLMLGKRDSNSQYPRSNLDHISSKDSHSRMNSSIQEQNEEIAGWVSKFEKVASLIKLFRVSIFVCTVCNLKFPSYKHYLDHENLSDSHKSNAAHLQGTQTDAFDDIPPPEDPFEVPPPEGSPPPPAEEEDLSIPPPEDEFPFEHPPGSVIAPPLPE